LVGTRDGEFIVFAEITASPIPQASAHKADENTKDQKIAARIITSQNERENEKEPSCIHAELALSFIVTPLEDSRRVGIYAVNFRG
jgi:hypothetical protein